MSKELTKKEIQNKIKTMRYDEMKTSEEYLKPFLEKYSIKIDFVNYMDDPDVPDECIRTAANITFNVNDKPITIVLNQKTTQQRMKIYENYAPGDFNDKGLSLDSKEMSNPFDQKQTVKDPEMACDRIITFLMSLYNYIECYAEDYNDPEAKKLLSKIKQLDKEITPENLYIQHFVSPKNWEKLAGVKHNQRIKKENNTKPKSEPTIKTQKRKSTNRTKSKGER